MSDTLTVILQKRIGEYQMAQTYLYRAVGWEPRNYQAV